MTPQVLAGAEVGVETTVPGAVAGVPRRQLANEHTSRLGMPLATRCTMASIMTRPSRGAVNSSRSQVRLPSGSAPGDLTAIRHREQQVGIQPIGRRDVQCRSIGKPRDRDGVAVAGNNRELAQLVGRPDARRLNDGIEHESLTALA